MTIIEAQKHLDGDHLKQFIESAKTDVIVITNAEMTFKFEFPKATFIKDFLETDDAAIDEMSGNDLLFIISDEVVLQTLVNDYRWYHGSPRRITRLLNDVYGTNEEAPKVKRQTSKQIALAQKEEEMKKERIFALMVADDIDGIVAFKGTGVQCLEWLNRQFVKYYDRIDDIKLHLNLTENSSISEFKTVAELIEEGSLIA